MVPPASAVINTKVHAQNYTYWRVFMFTAVAHLLSDSSKLCWLAHIPAQTSCVGTKTLPCSHVRWEAGGRRGSAAAPCADMCFFPALEQQRASLQPDSNYFITLR